MRKTNNELTPESWRPYQDRARCLARILALFLNKNVVTLDEIFHKVDESEFLINITLEYAKAENFLYSYDGVYCKCENSIESVNDSKEKSLEHKAESSHSRDDIYKHIIEIVEKSSGISIRNISDRMNMDYRVVRSILETLCKKSVIRKVVIPNGKWYRTLYVGVEK